MNYVDIFQIKYQLFHVIFKIIYICLKKKVLVRRINSDLFVEPGKVYVLDTVNGVMLKVVTIRRDGYLYCTSINSDQVTYAPFEIPISCVYGMYRVLMCISEK